MLIPFSPEYAQKIQEWNRDETAYRFWRGCTRYLTFDECSKLPEVIGCEVLLMKGNNSNAPLGIITIREEAFKNFRVGMLIDENCRQLGIGKSASLELEDYLLKRGGARMVLHEAHESDVAAIAGVESLGFIRAGFIPDYTWSNGKYEGIYIYYKKLGV